MLRSLTHLACCSILLSALSLQAISVFDVHATRKNKPSFHQVGNHIIAEFKDCKRNLNNIADLPAHLTKAAHDCGATLLDIETHQFQPEGVSGIAILSESHIALHTWPEYDYVAVDIFTCGDHIELEKALRVLVEFYQPEDLTYIEFDRGFLERHKADPE